MAEAAGQQARLTKDVRKRFTSRWFSCFVIAVAVLADDRVVTGCIKTRDLNVRSAILYSANGSHLNNTARRPLATAIQINID